MTYERTLRQALIEALGNGPDYGDRIAQADNRGAPRLLDIEVVPPWLMWCKLRQGVPSQH
jgi:hypothetical protein